MKKDYAKEYATALFDLSLEKNNIELFSEQLKIVANSIEENEQFIKLMSHPQISKEEKVEIIKKVYDKLNETVLHFLYVVVVNNRIYDIKFIYEEFDKLYNEYNKVINVVAQSTIPLSQNQLESLKNKLTIKYRHKIEINNIIDKDVIGGMRLIINNEVLDYSIKSQMRNLKSHILKQGR